MDIKYNIPRGMSAGILRASSGPGMILVGGSPCRHRIRIGVVGCHWRDIGCIMQTTSVTRDYPSLPSMFHAAGDTTAN